MRITTPKNRDISGKLPSCGQQAPQQSPHRDSRYSFFSPLEEPDELEESFPELDEPEDEESFEEESLEEESLDDDSFDEPSRSFDDDPLPLDEDFL